MGRPGGTLHQAPNTVDTPEQTCVLDQPRLVVTDVAPPPGVVQRAVNVRRFSDLVDRGGAARTRWPPPRRSRRTPRPSAPPRPPRPEGHGNDRGLRPYRS